MKNVLLKAAALACAPMFFLSAAPGAAQTYPTDPGDFWDVTGIEMLDGGDLQYLQWIASEWKKEQEFAKSKGWIKSYHVLSNLYPRQGEADLYLVIIYGDFPNAKAMLDQRKAYMDWQSKSLDQLNKENGNRAAFRKVVGSEFLQEQLLK
ncbi:MAG TPA: hypothetical protein VFF84_07185 [Sphingobium sp.]|nr:hypothetical protein [Sphingobium sp.]